MIASTQAREQLLSQNAKAKDRIAELEEFVRRFRANKSQGTAGDLARPSDREDQDRGREAFEPAESVHPLRLDGKQKLHRHAVEIERRRQGRTTSRCSRT